MGREGLTYKSREVKGGRGGEEMEGREGRGWERRGREMEGLLIRGGRRREGRGGKREREGSSGYCVFPRGARIVTAASEYDERISHC